MFRHFTVTGRLYSCNPNIQCAPYEIQYTDNKIISIYV